MLILVSYTLLYGSNHPHRNYTYNLLFFQQRVFPPNTFSFLDPVFALDSNVSLAKAFFAMDKDLCMSEKADCRQRLPTSVTIAALRRQGFCSFFFSVALQAC